MVTGQARSSGNVATAFFEIAARFPARVAVLGVDTPPATYEVLAKRVQNRRAWLHGLGLRSGEVVAVAVEDPVELVAVLFAILAEGMIYTVLDAKLPPARLQFIIEDCGAQFILADSGGAALANGAVGPTMAAKVLLLPTPVLGLHAPVSPTIPAELAYICYTSGSTDMPKGVIFRHENIFHEVSVHTEALALSEQDCFTWLYPASTVGCTRDLYGALLNGAAIAPFPFRQRGMAALRDWIRSQRLTQYYSVPPIFRELMLAMEPSGTLGDLRTVFLAGDRVAWSDVDLQVKHTGPSCRFYTGLGTSETSSLYTHWFAARDATTDSHALPSGFPIPDVRVSLCDPRGQAVPPGETGEICVQSRFLATGYWHRTELTQASFLPAPDGSVERVYKTGDFGTLDSEGRLIYRGRRDQQVKVLGQRIDLSEIDLCLRDLPGAREVAVRVIEATSHTTKIVGYVAWLGVPLTEADAKLRLAARLPAAAIPTRLIWVDHFPQSANGKIDYNRLPSPDSHPEPGASAWLPSDERETKLVALWQTIFPHWTPTHPSDSFADLGGDSLKAVELNLLLRAQLGIAVTGDEFTRGISLLDIAKKLTVGRTDLPAASGIAWETARQYRDRLAAGVQTWRLPKHAQIIADGLAALLPGPGPLTPLVWLPLMKEDFDLALEASQRRTVYLLQPGLFAIPKDRALLDPWFRDLRRILQALRVDTIRCGGFCTGGLAALLLAREFSAHGGNVEQLIILDAHGSEWTRWVNRRVLPQLRIRTRLRGFLDRLNGKPAPPPGRDIMPKESPVDFDREPYDGPTVLAMASQSYARRWFLPRWGWTHPTHRHWAIRQIPGTHMSIFDAPNRSQLLDLLSPPPDSHQTKI